MHKNDVWRKHIERSFNGGNNAMHIMACQDEKEKEAKKATIVVRIIEEDAWDGERSAISFWRSVEWEGGEMSDEEVFNHVKEIIHWEVSKMMQAMV